MLIMKKDVFIISPQSLSSKATQGKINSEGVGAIQSKEQCPKSREKLGSIPSATIHSKPADSRSDHPLNLIPPTALVGFGEASALLSLVGRV